MPTPYKHLFKIKEDSWIYCCSLNYEYHNLFKVRRHLKISEVTYPWYLFDLLVWGKRERLHHYNQNTYCKLNILLLLAKSSLYNYGNNTRPTAVTLFLPRAALCGF